MKLLRCPVCKGTNLVPYYDPELTEGIGTVEIPYSSICFGGPAGKEVENSLYEDVNYVCPECNRFSLRFKCEGMWD